jgi:broad specificity phosphatase PhoE
MLTDRDKEKFCTMYVVRHGESEWNVKKLIQGHKGSPLTEQGKSQVRALADALTSIRFDAVYSSDLSRARDTAEMIALERKLAVRTTEALRERSYGAFEGRHKEEFERSTAPLLKKFAELFDRSSNHEFLERHNIEDDEALAGRVITYLREIAAVHATQTVLVVTHGAVMRTLLVHLGFASEDEMAWGAIGNAAFVALSPIRQAQGDNADKTRKS